MTPLRLALVGLDSSHSVEIARLLHGDAPEAARVAGLRVTSCCRFPSRFMDEPGQDGRAKQLADWGVPCAATPEAAAADADGLLLCLNDPADHLPFVERLAPLGKPIFLDKPLADTSANARAVLAVAAKAGVPLWSASTVPLLPPMREAARALAAPDFAHVYGPLGAAAAGSAVVWYGCHTLELLVALMGSGAKSLRAATDERGVVARVAYPAGRAVIELCKGRFVYGGRVSDPQTTRTFHYQVESIPWFFRILVEALREFFAFGVQPVPTENALAALLLAEAIERSLADGGAETAVAAAGD